MMLSGPWAPKGGEEVALVYLNMDTQQRGDVVFRAREQGEELLVEFSAPLSAFQVRGSPLALGARREAVVGISLGELWWIGAVGPRQRAKGELGGGATLLAPAHADASRTRLLALRRFVSRSR